MELAIGRLKRGKRRKGVEVIDEASVSDALELRKPGIQNNQFHRIRKLQQHFSFSVPFTIIFPPMHTLIAISFRSHMSIHITTDHHKLLLPYLVHNLTER